MFAALVTYKENHDDCDVSRGWPKNPQLSTWVNTQRFLRKRDNLDADRIRRLDELAFD
jgi:hypothetical protein